MITYKIKNNSITINNKTTNLSNSIKKVFEYKDILIILLNYKDKSMDNEPNVIAFSNKGNKIWEITPIKDFNNKYIDIKEEKELLILIGSDHFKYIVNETDGSFKKERIQPLKDIDDDNEILFTKQNAIQLAIIIVILIIILASIKNFFGNLTIIPNNPTPNNSMNIENTENEISNNIENEETPKNSQGITEEEHPEKDSSSKNEPSNSTEKIETPSEDNSDKKEENTQSDNKYEGIDKFVDIADSIIGAITNGESTSIEDVNGTILNCTYISTIDSCRIKVNLNGKETIIKLIGIDSKSDCKSRIENILANTTTLYIEQDNKKKDSNGNLLAYIWFTESKDDKNNMLNYYLIKNGYAKFEMQSPNVKYNYYFQKSF